MLRSVLLLALLCAVPAKAGLFGSVEYRRDAGAPTENWRAMAMRSAEGVCTPLRLAATRPFPDVAPGGFAPLRQIAGCGRPAIDPAKLLASLRGLTPLQELSAVNRAVNRVPYVEDRANYGVDDYWASLGEFLRRGGDCEDYAIAKYTLLRRAGLPAEAMRVAVVRDLALATSHAILVVTLGSTDYVLDNQAAEVRPTGEIGRYQPVYSINETGWWLHMPR